MSDMFWFNLLAAIFAVCVFIVSVFLSIKIEKRIDAVEKGIIELYKDNEL